MMNDKKLRAMLKKNPYMKEEQIGLYFEKQLKEVLDREFLEYVTEDDYYEPVVEDFEAEYYAKEWGKKNGFELISFDGNEDTGEYDVRGRHW